MVPLIPKHIGGPFTIECRVMVRDGKRFSFRGVGKVTAGVLGRTGAWDDGSGGSAQFHKRSQVCETGRSTEKKTSS